MSTAAKAKTAPRLYLVGSERGQALPLGKPQATGGAAVARALPFALFMAFVGLEEGARLLASAGLFMLPEGALYYLYPLKASSVALLLFLYRRRYSELSLSDLAARGASALSILTGLLVFFLWVMMDWANPVTGPSAGFNPALLPAGPIRVAMTLLRMGGAVLVAPLMEELFWRSFLLRYLIAADFEKIPVGRFTWGSFAAAAILFGMEHHLFFAGVMAGALYSLLLYKTRSIAQCVLAHAVTNLALACYVIHTGRWDFW